MILQSLRVAGWRCFVDPTEIGPFGEELNVLHAPNGTGKSTLFEALLRGLLDGHRVSGREIEAIRPWGRSLAPTVVVEFSYEGVEYRMTKRFLEGAFSKLERKENGRFVGLAEDQAADERGRGILTQNPPGRGLARHENRGLAQVLWALQGELPLGRLSGDLVTNIRTSLGDQISGVGTGPIEERIEQVYLQFFTPGGKLKTGRDAPAIVSLKEKLQAAIEKRQAALEQQQDFEEAARKVEDLRAERDHARRDAETVLKELKDARTRAEVYKTLFSEQQQQGERLKSAEAQYNELKQRCEAIKAAEKELQGARDTLRFLEEDAPLRAREAEEREKEVAKAKAALEDAKRGQQTVDEARQKAEEAQQYLDSKGTVEELGKRLDRIEEAQASLAQSKKESSDLVAPDAKTLRAIRKAIKERDEAQVQIEAALITLEIVPEQDGSLIVVSGEPSEIQTLSSGNPLRIKGSPEVVADLPGTGRIRVWGPPCSIEEYRQKKDRAERRLRKHTESFGTDDLEELEGLRDKARELDKKVAEADTHLETLLSDGSIEDIQQERSKNEAVLSKVLDSYPDWKSDPPEIDVLVALAEEAEHVHKKGIESAEADWTTTQSAFTAAAERSTKLTVQLGETEKLVKSLESRMAELSSDRKQDEEREKNLGRLAMAWDAARAGLEEIEKQLSDFGDDPRAAVATLERQLEAASASATEALEDEKTEEGRVEHLSAQGPYSALVLAEEEISKLEGEMADERLRVAGICLLRDMVAQCRKQALAAVTGPVEAVATRILHRIAGTRLGRVQFGESFEPAHVEPELAEMSVTLDNISGGEEEQIHLATRLALAEVLAKEERQLVILDDVLTATDAGRLARVMTILEEAAQNLQILILTCHPERYRGLEQAHFIDLDGILRT